LISAKRVAVIDRKTAAICLAIILWAVLAAFSWRFLPPDADCVLAVSLYSKILEETTIVGLEYSPLTTTLGSYAIKRSSENPVIAALMVRQLKDAGLSSDSVVAINASGSFPGFTLAALSACAALDLQTYIIASIGSSTYGANIPGNTIADMLLENGFGRILLAVTPGGSTDRGLELDDEELERISRMLESYGVPFILPENLIDAINLRESLFDGAGCKLLINIGGSHAAIGNDIELALMAGVLKPGTTFEEAGLVQNFLAAGRPVIQILNVNKLYESYGLDFDQNGNLLSDSSKIYRWKRLSPLVTLLPIFGILVLLARFRYQSKNQRQS